MFRARRVQHGRASVRRGIYGIAACAFAGALTSALPASAGIAERGASEELLTAELQATRLNDPRRHAISSDGRWIAYAAARADVDSNQVTVELRLRPTHGTGPERILARHTSQGGADWITPAFSADSRSLAFLEGGSGDAVTIVDLQTGKTTVVRPRLNDPDAKILAVRWARGSSRLLLQITRQVVRPPLRTGVSVSVEWNLRAGLEPPRLSRVAVVERASGAVLAETPATFLVKDFDPSPTSDLMALAGYTPAKPGQNGPSDGQRFTAVHLFDPATGELRQIAGAYSSEPRFSPDGRLLYISTPADGDVYKAGQVGLYDLRTGRLERFGDEGDHSLQEVQWLDDRTLVGSTNVGFGCAVGLVDVRTRRTRLVAGQPLDCDHAVAVAMQAREVVFSKHRFDTMADLWASRVDEWRPWRVTDLNPELNARLQSLAEIRFLTWPSADGRFTVSGVLLTPTAGRGPFPLIASVMGGPSTVNALRMNDEFGQHLNYPSLARGYAVLIPTTRGRGGFGRDFEEAMRAFQDYAAGPLSDVLGGVKLVEEMGIAAPGRTSWNGFSYGASLGAYAITQTDKFKAAVLGDSGEQDYLNNALRRAASYGNHIDRSISGVADPYSPEGAERLRSFSALTFMNRARTPTMLQCGVQSPSMQQGCLLIFQGLQHFGVPSEFVVYPRTGHGIVEPALQFDAERRRLDWLDRWTGAGEALP